MLLLIYLFFSGRLADPHFFHFSFFSFLWYKEVAHLFILLPAALLAFTYLFILLRANLPKCTYLFILFIAWCRHDAYLFILSRRPGRPSFFPFCNFLIFLEHREAAYLFILLRRPRISVTYLFILLSSPILITGFHQFGRKCSFIGRKRVYPSKPSPLGEVFQRRGGRPGEQITTNKQQQTNKHKQNKILNSFVYRMVV